MFVCAIFGWLVLNRSLCKQYYYFLKFIFSQKDSMNMQKQYAT